MATSSFFSYSLNVTCCPVDLLQLCGFERGELEPTCGDVNMTVMAGRNTTDCQRDIVFNNTTFVCSSQNYEVEFTDTIRVKEGNAIILVDNDNVKFGRIRMDPNASLLVYNYTGNDTPLVRDLFMRYGSKLLVVAGRELEIGRAEIGREAEVAFYPVTDSRISRLVVRRNSIATFQASTLELGLLEIKKSFARVRAKDTVLRSRRIKVGKAAIAEIISSDLNIGVLSIGESGSTIIHGTTSNRATCDIEYVRVGRRSNLKISGFSVRLSAKSVIIKKGAWLTINSDAIFQASTAELGFLKIKSFARVLVQDTVLRSRGLRVGKEAFVATNSSDLNIGSLSIGEDGSMDIQGGTSIRTACDIDYVRVGRRSNFKISGFGVGFSARSVVIKEGASLTINATEPGVTVTANRIVPKRGAQLVVSVDGNVDLGSLTIPEDKSARFRKNWQIIIVPMLHCNIECQKSMLGYCAYFSS